MAHIRPFKGVRYSPSLDSDLGRLLCPPYDVIDPEQQRELHGRSPYNAVRLELGMDLPTDSAADNRYTRAAALLEQWLGEGVLIPEKEPAFYLVREEFSHLGCTRTRRSLLARVRLEEFSRRVILPHEETSQGPKRDRLELLKTTRANLSPIMGIYRDPSGAVGGLLDRAMSEAPLVNTEYGGTRIGMWALTGRGATQTVTDSLVDAPIYLADGHHRYETALHYRELRRSAGGASGRGDGYSFVMMTLIEIQDPGLLALPYHRMVRGLSSEEMDGVMALVKRTFARRPFVAARPGEDMIPRLVEQLESTAATRVSLGLLEHGARQASILTLRDSPGAASSPLERSAVWVLASKVLEPVVGTQEEAVERGVLRFTHDPGEVLQMVSGGEYQMGFVLPPLPMDVFEEVVLSGERLPIKSTYFSPKLPTGLVINRLV